MIIKKMMAGTYAANCYILFDEATKEAVVLDPGGDIDDICRALKELSANAKYIILTHGHFDHTTGVDGLKAATGAIVAMSKEDNDMILNKSMYYGPLIKGGANMILKHGDVLKFGNCKIEVIATPGHTPGGICLLTESDVFTGDTLFKQSIGRSDLTGGDHNTLISSIKEKLMSLSDNVAVHPGHGPSSTIGEERAENPFL
ncbi:MAG: MBL fold metallo-hydrolase [Clostridium sp.]|uniref:MBL fold metallo-hydrolase n=1 Tax=Clostridium sp. TaxID=1506 RepID=UPI00304B2F92